METQVSRDDFSRALRDLGHDPEQFRGRKLSLKQIYESYGISEENLVEAIERRLVMAHYDYQKDTIWVDALEAAHFYYCIRNEAHLYSDSETPRR